MKLDDIKLLYEYNYWANKLILALAEKLSPADYVEARGYSFGGLHGTLVHTMDTEYGWRLLCHQGIFTEDLNPNDLDLDLLRARWDAEEVEMWAYLNSLSDADMEGMIEYKVEEGLRRRVLWHCLWHVVNHGMQHRSECAVMLTDLGHSPGNLDFTRFLNVKAGIE